MLNQISCKNIRIDEEFKVARKMVKMYGYTNNKIDKRISLYPEDHTRSTFVLT